MFQWVTSEMWFLIAIVSLYVYLTKGINYHKSIWDFRNQFFIMLIPISVLQMVISALEIWSPESSIIDYATKLLLIYGAFLFFLMYYFRLKTKETRIRGLIEISIYVIGLIFLLGLKYGIF